MISKIMGKGLTAMFKACYVRQTNSDFLCTIKQRTTQKHRYILRRGLSALFAYKGKEKKENVKKNGKKIAAVALAMVMGLSCTAYPVYAQEGTEANAPGTVEDPNTQEQNGKTDETVIEKNETTESDSLTDDEKTSVGEETDTATDKTAEPKALDETAAYAANNAGSFNVTGGTAGADWTYDSGANTLTFKTDGTYTVTGDGQETNEKIVVGENFIGTITIENININVGSTYGACAFEVNNTAQLTLNLRGDNQVNSGANRAGLEFGGATDGSLTVTSDSNGSLTATTEWYGAGIGGRFGEAGNNITIAGGNVTATGGSSGAGIGGGSGAGSNITITGGIVAATSTGYGAGIGGGESGAGNNITITGGTVTARSGAWGAGIGGGRGFGSDITITGGTVTATGGNSGAGIGDGDGGSGSNITITGGTVTAWGAGIDGGSIMIIGGSVKADRIGTTPTDRNGNNVYLAKIDGLSGTNTVIVDETVFSRNGDHPDGDGAFYLYLTGQDHTVTVNGQTTYIGWNGSAFVVKQGTPTPEVMIQSKTSTGITVQPLADTDTYGKAEYSIDGQSWQSSNVFTGLKADTEYTVYARYKGNDTYIQSEAGSTAVKTMKDGSALIADKKPIDLTGVYGQKLSDITLTDGWIWANGDTPLSVGEQAYSARFDTTSYEDEYDFTGVDGYNAENHYVETDLTVNAAKADSRLTITTDNMDKSYDGQAVSDPEVEKTGSTNDVTFTWYEKSGSDWAKLDEAPVNAGSYKVVAGVEADDNYNGVETEKTFEITKAIPVYTVPDDLIIKQGEALSAVSLPEGFTWSDDTQTADTLGKQTFKAIFTPTDTTNYQTVEVDINVEVVPALTPGDKTGQTDTTQTIAKTGDHANIYVWSALAVLAALSILFTVLFRRRKKDNKTF